MPLLPRLHQQLEKVMIETDSGIEYDPLGGGIGGGIGSVSVARGSLIVGDATPEYVELAIGAADTLLKSNSTTAAWGFAALDELSDAVLAGVAQGDLFIRGAAAWNNLAAAAVAGNPLISGGAGADASWSTQLVLRSNATQGSIMYPITQALTSGNALSFETSGGVQLTAAASRQAFAAFEGELFQSGTASYSLLYANATETQLGGVTANYLLHLAKDGVDQFRIDNFGSPLLPNDTWIRWVDSTGLSVVNGVKVDSSNGLVIGNSTGILPLSWPADTLTGTAIDTAVTGDQAANTVHKYALSIGNTSVAEVYSQSVGGGGGSKRWAWDFKKPVIETPSSDQAIGAAGTISPDAPLVRVAGSGAPRTAGDPNVTAGFVDGLTIKIQGTDSTKPVTLEDESTNAGSLMELAGGASCVLGQGDFIVISWDNGDGKWYEISRSAAVLADLAEMDAGTEAAKAISPNVFKDSAAATRLVALPFLADGEVATVTNDQFKFCILPELNGYDLVSVYGWVDTAGVGAAETMDVQIRNETSGPNNDMLTTKLKWATGVETTDGNEVIDATKDDVTTGDVLCVDIDTIHTVTSAAAGCGIVYLGFRLP